MDLFDIAVAKKLAGGGGGSSYTLLHESEYEISLSTGTELLATINIPNIFASTLEKMIFIRTRRKEGKPSTGFYGTDIFIARSYPNSSSDITAYQGCSYIIGSNGIYMTTIRSGSTGGIYPTKITSDDDIIIYAGYQSSRSGVIDGTYVVQIYALDWPDGVSPFN